MWLCIRRGCDGVARPATLKPRGKSSLCMLFLKLHSGKIIPETIFTHYTQNSILSSFFTNEILRTATENFSKQQTHRRPILLIRDDKACLCHNQDGKLLRVLRLAAINNSANALCIGLLSSNVRTRNVKIVPTPLEPGGSINRGCLSSRATSRLGGSNDSRKFT